MAAMLSLSPNPPITTLPSLRSTFKGNLRNLKPNPFHIIRIRTKQQGVEAQKGTRSLVVVNQAATTQVSVTASNVRFRLDNLGPQPGSRKKGKRKGRGISAGQGGSCGFGMRGQKSRSGPGVRKGFEGGQMPLYRRIPKLRGIAGGMHAGLPKYIPVNLKDIETAGFQEGDEVSSMDKLLSLSFTFLVFIFMVFKLWMRSKRKEAPKNLPPAPWKLPIIGHLHLLIFALPHQRLTELAKRHGSLMHLQLGELSHVVVSSPEAAKEVMITHDISFANRPFLLGAEIVLYNLSDIAFAPYGSCWRQLRKVCKLELLSMKRVQSFRSVREEQVSSLIRSIFSKTGKEINLGEMLCNLSYNITLRTAFAGRCKKHGAFISFLKKFVEAMAGFNIADLFPSIKFLPELIGMRAELERFHHDIDAMLESIIQEHRDSSANPKDSVDVTEDLVDVLLNLQDHGGLEFPLTTDNIKAVILDILMGGTETSSTLAEWAMSEMIKNPRILGKAQAEVRELYDKTGDVNESNLHELKYLKLVIKETLRLHPPLPLLIPRENSERCEINGYEIPAKTRVIINAWAIGRDSNYWNEAERFYPERFIKGSVDYKGTNFEFIPFGAGRRICPGMSYGMAVVELSLAKLLYHFDWKLPNGMKNEYLDMAEAFGASVRRKKELHVIPIPYHLRMTIEQGRSILLNSYTSQK